MKGRVTCGTYNIFETSKICKTRKTSKTSKRRKTRKARKKRKTSKISKMSATSEMSETSKTSKTSKKNATSNMKGWITWRARSPVGFNKLFAVFVKIVTAVVLRSEMK